MAGYDDSVIIDVGVNAKKASSQLMALENRMTKIADKVTALRQKMDSLRDSKLPTQEYTEIQNQISEAEKKLAALNARQEKFLATGGSTESSTYKKMQYDIDELEHTIEYAKGELQELVDTGQAFTLGSESEEYAQLEKSLESANAELAVMSKRHDELTEKMNKSSGVLDKFSKRVLGLAKRVFVFSLITKAFRAMVSGIKEGLKNYVQYSKEYNKTMSDFSSSAATLKNSVATAAAPILNLLVPALTTVCGWLTTAANLISKFIAFISGKSTWTRAKKQQIDYAKSLQSTASAADSAKSSLAAFDDLDVLQQDTDSGTSSDGGELTGSDAFEDVAFTDADVSLLEKIKEIMTAILPIAVAIGAVLLTWKLTSFLTGLMATSPILGTILSILFIIAGAVISVWSYLHMWKNGVDWQGLIGYIVGVAMVFAGLYALFGPVVAGIALIVAGIAGFVLALKDIYENGLNVQNMSLLLISIIALVVGAFIAFGSTVAIVIGGIAALVALYIVAMAKMGKLQEFAGYLQASFAALGQFMKDVFAGDWKAAWRDIMAFVVNIINAIITAFESLINLAIDGLNALISAAVRIANKIPGIDFSAPEISHVSFGRLPVPELANGGITAGDTLARIGEAGREAVLPLENNLNYLDEFAQRIADKIPAQSGPVYLQVDGKTFARLMNPYSGAETKRVGISFT